MSRFIHFCCVSLKNIWHTNNVPQGTSLWNGKLAAEAKNNKNCNDNNNNNSTEQHNKHRPRWNIERVTLQVCTSNLVDELVGTQRANQATQTKQHFPNWEGIPTKKSSIRTTQHAQTKSRLQAMGGCCTPIPETTAQTQYDRFSITELDRSSENGAPAQSQTIVCHFLTQSVGVVSCCLFRDIRNAGLCRNSNRYDLEPELGKQPHEQHLFRTNPNLQTDLQLKLQLAMSGCCCPALESSKNARSANTHRQCTSRFNNDFAKVKCFDCHWFQGRWDVRFLTSRSF